MFTKIIPISMRIIKSYAMKKSIIINCSLFRMFLGSIKRSETWNGLNFQFLPLYNNKKQKCLIIQKLPFQILIITIPRVKAILILSKTEWSGCNLPLLISSICQTSMKITHITSSFHIVYNRSEHLLFIRSANFSKKLKLSSFTGIH